jgi:hypothetical protein
MVGEPFVVRLLSWCVQVHVMYLILLISQTRKENAASLLQIPAFEELLSLVLNYFWTIMWKVFKMPGLGSIIPINRWIPATFNACSKPDPAFSTVYVVVFFVFSEFSEGEKRVVAISCVDERHCLILISDICALFWEMREHNKSVIESHIWKNDRKYNGRMTDNAVEWWQTKQWHNLIVTVVISIKLCPLNFEKSLKIPKSNQNLHVEEE